MLAIGEGLRRLLRRLHARARHPTRARGAKAQWRLLVPALADALEAMRLADLSATAGFGGRDEAGARRTLCWSELPAERGEQHAPQQRNARYAARRAEAAFAVQCAGLVNERLTGATGWRGGLTVAPAANLPINAG